MIQIKKRFTDPSIMCYYIYDLKIMFIKTILYSWRDSDGTYRRQVGSSKSFRTFNFMHVGTIVLDRLLTYLQEYGSIIYSSSLRVSTTAGISIRYNTIIYNFRTNLSHKLTYLLYLFHHFESFLPIRHDFFLLILYRWRNSGSVYLYN